VRLVVLIVSALAATALGATLLPGNAAAVSAGACHDLQVGFAQVAVSDARRDALGLDGWPDSAFGAVRRADGMYDFYAPAAFGGSGPTSQRNVVTVGTLADPTAGGVRASGPILNAPSGFQWIGGGPVYTDPATGTLLQIIHLEHSHPDGTFTAEWGLGRVDPASGRTTFLGLILRPELDDATAAARGWTADLGMSSLTVGVDDGVPYLYVYFADFRVGADNGLAATGLSVARARLSEVLDAARNGTVSPWYKRLNGAWTSPARGGRADDLQPGMPMTWAPHVRYSPALGATVMVAAVSPTELVMSTSPDGITNWSPRVTLVHDLGVYDAYVSVVGHEADPTALGLEFSIYYLQWPTPSPDWSNNAALLRRTIRCAAPPPSAPPAPPPAVQPPAAKPPILTIPAQRLSRHRALHRGRVGVKLSARVAGGLRLALRTGGHRPLTLARARPHRARAGKLVVRVRLTPAGRRYLRRHRTTRSVVQVRFAPVGGSPVTVRGRALIR
jgi:hypothetical protein